MTIDGERKNTENNIFPLADSGKSIKMSIFAALITPNQVI